MDELMSSGPVTDALYPVGPPMRLRVSASGAPVCPHCGEPMEPVPGIPETWQCGEMAAASAEVRAGLERAAMRILGDRPPLQDPDGGRRGD